MNPPDLDSSSLDGIAELLPRACRALMKKIESSDSAALQTVAMESSPVEPIHWLAGLPEGSRFYWRSRGESSRSAGFGEAWRVRCDVGEDAQSFLERAWHCAQTEAPDCRLYGGLGFDAEAIPEAAWMDFGTGVFFVPLVELRSSDEGCQLLVHGNRDSLEALEALADQVISPRCPDAGIPPPVKRRDEPDQNRWRQEVQLVLDGFAEGRMEKVVLARRVSYLFEEAIDPFSLLWRLQDQTPACFHFLLQLNGGATLIGASPERLYRREGRQLWTEAVAGTRPRGATAAIDERLSRRLLESAKDQREHEYVRQAICDVLEPYCETLISAPCPGLLKLSRGQHLYTSIEAELRDGVQDPELVARLHPTPAVGGVPREAALQIIRTAESFSRGWYAAPLGWMETERAEFAVAIRSGRVDCNRLDLYSGAGIVEGSDPESEWSEIENKISDFIHILTQSQP